MAQGNFMNQIDSKYCRDCGQVITRSAATCPSCGARQGGIALGDRQHKSRFVAALLAFFLGSFGVHKFYLGRIGQGVLYLLFFWTFIPGLVALIEMIIYLLMSDKDFSDKYDR